MSCRARAREDDQAGKFSGLMSRRARAREVTK